MDRKTGLALSAAMALVVLSAAFTFGPSIGLFGAKQNTTASGGDRIAPTPVVTVEVVAPSEPAPSSVEPPVEIVDVPVAESFDDHGSGADEDEHDDEGDEDVHEDDDHEDEREGDGEEG